MEPVLKGVFAFVDVWSSNRRENYSKLFEQLLLDMGAKVSKALNKHVTHVVFKDGHLAKWKKAQKMGVKIVSVLWVEKCQQTGLHVDESLFPVLTVNDEFPLLMKKHRCMQPKDSVEKTPGNSRRVQRRLDQMAKELSEQKRAISAETDVPVLLFGDDGSLVYSPIDRVKKLCTDTERKVKEVKEEKENLSPTGEQMEECLNSSYLDYIWGTDKIHKTETVEHTSALTDIHVFTSASMSSPSCSHVQERLKPKQYSRGSLKKRVLQHTLNDKVPLEKEDLKKLPEKSPKNENSMSTSAANDGCHLHFKGLGQMTPYEKPTTLNTVSTLIGSLSNSPVNSEDINTCSFYRSCHVDGNSSIEEKMRKKVQALPSWKRTTSKPGASGSESEFLKAIITHNKSFCTEETSYEDFFSSSNESLVQIQMAKESQSFPEVCCEVSCASTDSVDGSFSKSHYTSKKNMEKSIPANGISVEKKIILAEHPGCVPLTCISDGEKIDTAEALDSDDMNRLPQQNHERSFRTNVNYCINTTGKSLYQAGR